MKIYLKRNVSKKNLPKFSVSSVDFTFFHAFMHCLVNAERVYWQIFAVGIVLFILLELVFFCRIYEIISQNLDQMNASQADTGEAEGCQQLVCTAQTSNSSCYPVWKVLNIWNALEIHMRMNCINCAKKITIKFLHNFILFHFQLDNGQKVIVRRIIILHCRNGNICSLKIFIY